MRSVYDITQLLVAADLAFPLRRIEYYCKYAAGRTGRWKTLRPLETAPCARAGDPLCTLGGGKRVVWRYRTVPQYFFGLAFHSGSDRTLSEYGTQGLWVPTVSAAVQVPDQQLRCSFFCRCRCDPDHLPRICLPEVFGQLLAQLFLFYCLHRLPIVGV